MHGAVDTATLAPDLRERVESALRGLPFGGPAAPAAHPDGFTYEITVHDGDGTRTATVDGSQLPPDLAGAVQLGL
jgi:hypothetical protein